METRVKPVENERLLRINFFGDKQDLNVLCLGAHPDDIEIGCGGTILRLIEEVPDARFYWATFSGGEIRSKEGYASAEAFLKQAKTKKIDIQNFKESYFPFIGSDIKDYFGKLAKEFQPDIIFTHYRNDTHQDHRIISDLTWSTYRNNFILEYEIPKYDGDLGIPNLFVTLKGTIVEKKTSYLLSYFKTQKKKLWFDEKTFMSLLRIRGIECNSPSQYAEAFYCRKIVF